MECGSMKNFLVLLILAFVLSACGNVEEAQGEVNQETTEAIVAEVTMPEEAETGYQVLETQVTQAGEAVSGADEVIFEVWKHGDKENSEMIEQENEEDGVYSVGYIFENDGIYLVQPHVTAREMHTMPVHTIVVGDVNQEEIDAFDEYEVEKGSNSMDDHNHEHEYRHNADHDHSSGLDILMTIDNEPNPSVISAKLNMEGKAYEADRVRLEFINEADNKDIQWIAAKSQSPEFYSAELEDIKEGTYKVILHVNGPNDLHEHLEEVFKVN